MSPEIIIKLSNDAKLREYLRNNSYWYKYLNRDKNNYKAFLSAYKSNNRNEKINKASNAVQSLSNVNSILKMLK